MHYFIISHIDNQATQIHIFLEESSIPPERKGFSYVSKGFTESSTVQDFPNATLVSDRFHVQRLMNEAINDLRVDYRWMAIDQENKEIKLAKECNRKFIPDTFFNEDTRRQLLARSRHTVMKHRSKWTDSQRTRAQILFE